MENAFMTTIERKQMSNKTTFKRIALAVVAALGFGVLTLSPSSATVTTLTVTPTAGTATTAKSDSSTAATFAVSYIKTQTADTVVVQAYVSAAPTAAALSDFSTGHLRLVPVDSTGATMATTVNVDTSGGASIGFADTGGAGTGVNADSTTAVVGGSTTGTVAAKFRAYVDTALANTADTLTLVAGTYTITMIATPYNNGGAGTPITSSANIVVSALASASTTVDPSKSIAQLSDGSMGYSSTITTVDSALAVVATAASTDHATILVRTFNASSVAAPESVTASISGAGLLCNGSVCGSSLSLTGATGIETITVRANGVAGVGTINIATTSKTFAAKNLTFYAATPATLTPAVEIPVISTSATSDAVSVAAVDANGAVWAGTLYLYSNDTAVATAGSCTYNATYKVHYCSVTGLKAGTAKLQAGNASTLALATVTSVEWSGPVVNPNVSAKVTLSLTRLLTHRVKRHEFM